MNKTEYIGKLNALYVGEKNCLEELITAYDEKDKEIERLNNIIKEVREYIENNKQYAELEYEIEKRDNTLSKIKSIIDNEKITGIEAKLMIKDILEGIE